MSTTIALTRAQADGLERLLSVIAERDWCELYDAATSINGAGGMDRGAASELLRPLMLWEGTYAREARDVLDALRKP